MKEYREKKRKSTLKLVFSMIFCANRVKRNEINIHLFNNNVVEGGVYCT
jgi:ribosomal protein L20A (L18A)